MVAGWRVDMDPVDKLQQRIVALEAERDMLRMLFNEQRKRAVAANESYYAVRDWLLAQYKVKLPDDDKGSNGAA